MDLLVSHDNVIMGYQQVTANQQLKPSHVDCR